MKPTYSMINPAQAITSKDIERFERDQSIKVPVDYKSFLLNHNGGEISPNLVTIFANDSQETLRIDYFNSLIPEDTALNISLLQHMRRQEIAIAEGLQTPKEAIPIGVASSVDNILLFVSGEHYGEVWVKLWHVCGNFDYGNPWTHCYKIADTFAGFIEILHM